MGFIPLGLRRCAGSSRRLLVLVAAIGLAASSATAGVRDQCGAEIQKLCDPTQDSTAMIFSCLNGNNQALSPVCRVYVNRVVAAQRRSMAFKDACSQEYANFCPPKNGFKVTAAQKCLDVARDRLTPICVDAYDQYFSFLKTGNSGYGNDNQVQPQDQGYAASYQTQGGAPPGDNGMQHPPQDNSYGNYGAAAVAGGVAAYGAAGLAGHAGDLHGMAAGRVGDVRNAATARVGSLRAMATDKVAGIGGVAGGFADKARDLQAGGVAGLKKKALGGALAKAGLGDDMPGVGNLMNGDVAGALGGAKGALMGKGKDKKGELQKMAMGKLGGLAGGLGGGKAGNVAGKAKGLMALAGGGKDDDDDELTLDDDEDSSPKKSKKKKPASKVKAGAGLIGTFLGDE